MLYAQSDSLPLPIKSNGKWGLIDQKGKIILEPCWDYISLFDTNKLAICRKAEYFGLINTRGEMLMKPEYNKIYSLTSDIIGAQKEKNTYLLNLKTGRRILVTIPVKYFSPLNDKLIKISTDYSALPFGIMDTAGNIIAQPKYYIIHASENLIIVGNNERYGALNCDGKWVVPDSCLSIYYYDKISTIFFMQNNNRWGAIHISGKPLIDAKYKSIDLSHKYPHIFLTDANNKVCVYHTVLDKIICDPVYDRISELDSTSFYGWKDGKCGIFSTNGKELLPFIYDDIDDRSDFYIVERNNKYGIVNKNGKTIIPIEYHSIAFCNETLLFIEKNNRYGFARIDGTILKQPVADRIKIEGNIAKLYKQNSIEVVEFDKNWNITDQNTFRNFGTISLDQNDGNSTSSTTRIFNVVSTNTNRNKRGWFYSNSYWGLMDTTGAIVINPTFSNVSVIDSLNFSIVKLQYERELIPWYRIGSFKRKIDAVYGVVNHKTCKFLCSLILWDYELHSFLEGASMARCILENKRYGLLGKKGALAYKDFSYVGHYKNGLFRVNKGGKIADKYPQLKKNLYEESRPEPENSLYELKDLFLIRNEYISPGNDNKFYCFGGKWGFVDGAGKLAIQLKYDFVTEFSQGHAFAVKNGKWGIINQRDSVLADFQFDELHTFSEDSNYFETKKKYDRFFILNTNGERLGNQLFDEILPFEKGFAKVRIGNYWGFVDSLGKPITECKYDDLRSFSEHHAAFKSGDVWGLINETGKEIILPEYYKVGNFQEGRVWLYKNGTYGFADSTGKIVIPFQYHSATDFSGGVSVVRYYTKFIIIDKSGNPVIKTEYAALSGFDQNQRAIYRKKKLFGIVDKNGIEITPAKYKRISSFSEGLAAFCTNKKWGFIDTAGLEVIEDKYINIKPFKDGVAQVKLNKSWIYIDKSGLQENYRSPQQNPTEFISQESNKLAIKNKDGKYTTSHMYNELIYLGSDRFAGKIYTLSGIIDIFGNIIINPEFTDIMMVNDHIFQVSFGNKTGYVNKSKELIWKPTE
jgi:hypothetical protein